MVLNKNNIAQALELVIISSLFYSAVSAQTNRDSTSLNEQANQEVKKSISSKPPNIAVAVYNNGKEISKGYTVYLVINDKKLKEPYQKSIKLDMSKFAEGDSLAFLLQYKSKEIYSEKFSYKRFIHGGSVTTGVISDYAKEKKKFLLDEPEYFKNNQKNRLCDLIMKTKKNDKKYIEKKFQLSYSIVQSNITALVSFKYNFISVLPQ